MNNEKITISKTTAKTVIFFMTDYLYYINTLDKETREQIAALDELITALDYEEEYATKVKEIEDNNIKMNAEFHARQAEKAGE
jgi:hypothetical protein